MKTKSAVLKDFKHILELKYTADTVKNYTYHVSLFLDFCKYAPTRVTNNHILEYNIHIKEYSFSYRNVAINAIKAYFEYYLNRKTKDFAVIRPGKQKRLPRHIDHELLVSKIKAVTNQKHRLMLKLGYGCGLRSGEVVGLKLDNIDIEFRTLRIIGKGNKEREVPFSEDIAFELLTYCEYYEPDTYLFNGQKGGPYTKSSLIQIVKNHIGGYRYHDLRHSYATRLFESGVDAIVIQQLLGHSSLKTTMVYTYIKKTTIQQTPLPI